MITADQIFLKHFTVYLLTHPWPRFGNSHEINDFEDLMKIIHRECQAQGITYRQRLRSLRSMPLADHFTGTEICFFTIGRESK